MIKVIILGAGNVAHHLFNAFFASEKAVVVQVYNRSKESLNFFAEKTRTTTSLDDIEQADIYILALKDDAILEIAPQLKHLTGLVVHTSGSVGMEVLNTCQRRGVFYPLQTFSKSKKVDFAEIPICLEAASQEDFQLLEQLASLISTKTYAISSQQRKALHLSAVFVCNFVNHLYSVGEKICEEHQMPFELLQPLILETANKIKDLKPMEAQTGPALRQDERTLETHFSLLKKPTEREIYTLLTKSIQELHGKKL